jgi:glutamate-1-semialdehyde 2,1-aminomutase
VKDHRRSQALWERAQRSLAGGVSSNVRAGSSVYFERASAARLYDVDGNAYLDYVLGQGPMILGHSPEPVLQAVQQAMWQGQLYAGQHELEILLSEKIQQFVPCAELVRYSSSGSEVVQAAIRLARAYTGREKIVKFEGHYHGWFDNVLVSVHPPLSQAGPRERPQPVPASAGQMRSALDEVIVLPWNDLEAFGSVVTERGDQIAAVLMEPIMCNTGCILPQPGYLEGVRELCSQYGIVLIFDEVITGFRLGLSGAQGYLGITPDLATFGKAMANGFPVSCLAGKRELMELVASQQVNHSGTYNSNVMVMAAAYATLAELERNDGQAYQRLFNSGQQLMAGLVERARKLGIGVLVQGIGPMFHLAFTRQEAVLDYRSFLQCDQELYRQFASLLLEEGVRVLSRGLWYLSTAHTAEDIEFTLQAVEAAWARLLETNPQFAQQGRV